MTAHEDQKFNPEHHYDTSEVIDLKMRKLYSDLRLLIIASVALNQFLSQVALPSAVTVPAIAAAIFAPAAKGVLSFFRA